MCEIELAGLLLVPENNQGKTKAIFQISSNHINE